MMIGKFRSIVDQTPIIYPLAEVSEQPEYYFYKVEILLHLKKPLDRGLAMQEVVVLGKEEYDKLLAQLVLKE